MPMKVTFKSDVVWSGKGVKSVAHCNKHKLIIDEPPNLGGSDEGPNPVEFLLAGLGGCLNVVIAMLAPRYNVDLQDVKTSVEGDLDVEGFMEKSKVRTGFQQIRYHIEVKSNASKDKIEALIEHAVRLCPVKDTLSGVPVVRA